MFHDKRERNLLVINLWDNDAPSAVPFFDNHIFNLNPTFDKNETIVHLSTQDNKYVRKVEKCLLNKELIFSLVTSPRESSYFIYRDALDSFSNFSSIELHSEEG
jgi:hypothetical protein